MNSVLDSSAWIEYFSDGKQADLFAELIESGDFIVPTISIYEVYKKFIREYDETQALTVTNHMRKGKVVELNAYLAVWAAKLSQDLKLPMADSIILATAYATGSTVYTLDSDFEGIEGVNYVAKT